jgi:hypothetical protein
MITTRVPDTWQQLQNEVARILLECGFAVEIEKVIETARGVVEIDVYAEEQIRGRAFRTLCECKHWRAAIPQAIIHGFRTVVGDSGANKGYIISTHGFQAGAFVAAELTNIELVTWEQFQGAFEQTWIPTFFAPELLRQLDGLMTYAEPFLPMWFDKLKDEEQDRFLALKEQHEELGMLFQYLAMHHLMRRQGPFPTLPLSQSLAEKYDFARIPEAIAQARGYRQLLDASLEIGGEVLRQFREMRDGVAPA